MCGIVYVHDFDGKPVNNKVLNIFDAQRSRGTQGFGLFDGQEKNMVHASKEDRILKWLVKYDSNLILFHHRYPTSTVNVKKAAHPFSTKDHFGDTQYILVHNGHIGNASELRTAHEKMGIKYHSKLGDKTFNDSEALCWDLALTLEGKQSSLEAYGGVAFVCLKLVKGELEKMYFGRNGNPLKLKRDEHGISLSSEGEGEMVEMHQLYTYNYKLNRLTTKSFNIAQWKNYQSNGGEINEYSGRDWRYREETRPIRSGNVVEQVSSWLPRHLQQRWGKHLTPIGNDPVIDYDRDGNAIYASDAEFDSYDDYIRSKNGLYLPPGTMTDDGARDEGYWMDEDDLEVSQMDEEDLSEFLETYEPSKGQVESTMLQYLITAEGHFESAYWALEGDYEAIEETMEDGTAVLRDIKDARLLERSLSLLMDDPEYKDEKSVSSKWEALCNQMELQETLPIPV